MNNATNEHWRNKVRKEGKPHGNPPPQSTMYQKKRKTVARKLCPSLQAIAQRVKLLLRESLGEDVNTLFKGRTKLQVDDPLVD
jgi:hypothetical protein